MLGDAGADRATAPPSPHDRSGTAPRRRRRPVAFGLLAAFVVIILMFTWMEWGSRTAEMGSPARSEAGIPLSPADHPWYFPVLIGHIMFASIALAAGLLQLSSWVRRRRPRWHRHIGRVYVFGAVLPGLVLAVALKVFWPFSAVTSVSQWTLCALWGFATATGWVMRRRGRIAEHRRWMFRSYAMTASAVAVVVVEPFVEMAIRPEFATRLAGDTDVYLQVTSSTENWLALVLVIVGVEWYLERERSRAARRGPGSDRVAA